MLRTLAIAVALASEWCGAANLLAAEASFLDVRPQTVRHAPLANAVKDPGAYVQPPPSNPPETRMSTNDKPGRKDVPISILPSGNRLVLVSDDPEALRLAQDLIRLMTQKTSGEGDFEVIRLKHANATDTARLLDELYNGARPQSGPGQRGGSNPFGDPTNGPVVSTPTGPRENRIRVVADPGTNALLLRATAADVMSIRRLLEKSVDVGKTDSSALRRTWLLPPLKYASALEVAHVLRQVYQEAGSNRPAPATTGGFAGPGFPGFGGEQNPGAEAVGTNGRPSSLSIGVDDRSNSLVLVCSEKMKDEVKGVIDQLENAAKTATRTVRVIPLKGVDPLLVQQAIEAIQGRNRSAPRSNSGGMPEVGPARFGPTGWNGFLPNGFGPANQTPAGINPGGFLPPASGVGASPAGPGSGPDR